MAEFNFSCTIYLGFSHCGEVTAEGKGTIELSDEEVAALVVLMREKGSTDVNELNLEEVYPEIYEKLDDAFRDAAWTATLDHWYTTGFYEGVYEYDVDVLMEYCEYNCNFVFEYDESDYLDDDGEVDEDAVWDAKYDAFMEWLEPYIENLNPEERIAFLQEHMNAEVELSEDELDYEVDIPEDIKNMR